MTEAFGDGRDQWAYLNLTTAWPAAKGDPQRTLDDLAEWVVEHVRPELEG